MRVLNHTFQTNQEIQKAYMSFVQGLGIFIRSTEDFKLGENILLKLNFPDAISFELEGKVIWITPDPSKITWISTSTTAGDEIYAGAGFQLKGAAAEACQQKITELMRDLDVHFISDTI